MALGLLAAWIREREEEAWPVPPFQEGLLTLFPYFLLEASLPPDLLVGFTGFVICAHTRSEDALVVLGHSSVSHVHVHECIHQFKRCRGTAKTAGTGQGRWKHGDTRCKAQ
jgi:hypothetical protein